MTRHPDWPERLHAFIESRRDLPFEWGTHDCVLMAADWVREATGVDPIEGWRGRWRSTSEAARLLVQAGGIPGAVAERLGKPLESVLLAGRGDIALFVHEGRKTLGVVTDAGLACPGEQGMVIVPVADAEAAWRV